MQILGDILAFVLLTILMFLGFRVILRRPGVKGLIAVSIAYTAIAFGGQFLGLGLFPSFVYGLEWGTSFWYMVPPWTALHSIWSFFGPMTYGYRGNQWAAYALACAIYALPYLILFAITRRLARVEEGKIPLHQGIHIILRAVSYIAVTLWLLLTLTGWSAILVAQLS